MADLDLGRITQKAADIRENIAVLRDYAEKPDALFLSNPESIRAARYSFIIVVEAAVNIAAHICARLLSKAPASQRDSFMLLAKSHLLPDSLALSLSKMAGFRNLLVHGYAVADDGIMLRLMRNDLDDVEDFVRRAVKMAGESR